MSAMTGNSDWLEANQRYLVEQFARLKARLAGENNVVEAVIPDSYRRELPPCAIDVITEAFGLSSFERELLLLCAGVEMDAELAAQCAAVQGYPQRTYATFGLALGALAEPHWSALTSARPLRRWRLIDVNEDTGLASARLRIEERVLHFLAGIDVLDARLRPLLRFRGPAELMADAHRTVADSIAQTLATRQAPMPLIQLVGDDACGQEDVAANIAAGFGLQLGVLRAEDVPAGAHELDAFCILWERESVLQPGALLIAAPESTGSTAVTRLAERPGGLTILRRPRTTELTSSRLALHGPQTKRAGSEALVDAVLGEHRAATQRGT